jgi:hypothetical protein
MALVTQGLALLCLVTGSGVTEGTLVKSLRLAT